MLSQNNMVVIFEMIYNPGVNISREFTLRYSINVERYVCLLIILFPFYKVA